MWKFAPLISMLIASECGHAGVIVFTDRPTWQSSVFGGVDQSEDFNAFVTDTIYSDASPLVLGNMTVTGGPPHAFLRVDVPPYVDGQMNVDGTPSLAALTALGTSSPVLTFADPLDGIGFDLGNINDFALATRIDFYDPNAVQIGTYTPAATAGSFTRFFGFNATGGDRVSQIRFEHLSSADAFALDNLEMSIAVPEPSTFMMLGIGAIAIGIHIRRRRVPA